MAFVFTWVRGWQDVLLPKLTYQLDLGNTPRLACGGAKARSQPVPPGKGQSGSACGVSKGQGSESYWSHWSKKAPVARIALERSETKNKNTKRRRKKEEKTQSATGVPRS